MDDEFYGRTSSAAALTAESENCGAVGLGLGHIVTLYYRLSGLY
jgi:hypothetical protein